MKVTVRNLTANGIYDEYVSDFRLNCQAAGAAVSVDVLPPPERRLDAEWSRIVLEIDPQTLKLLAQYAAAAVAVWKIAAYADEFFKAAAKKLGDMTGAKIGEAIATLWERIIKRIKAPPPESHPGVEFILHAQLLGTDVVAAIGGIYSRTIEELSEKQVENLLSIRPVLYCLFPMVEEFIRQAQVAKVELHHRVSVSLRPTGHSHGSWCWEVEIAPIGRFCLDQHGVLRTTEPLKCFVPMWLRRRRLFLSDGIAAGDIARIVKQYKRNPRGIRPLS